MRRFTCLPRPVSNGLQVLRPMFRPRHHLVFCWWLVCQAVSQEKATITGVARLAPRHVAEWHLRRLLTASYWHARILLWWFADQVVAMLPPPEAGVCSLMVDSTLKGNTARKPPWAQTGRLNAYAPSIQGLHIGVVMLQWGHDRIPVAFEMVRRQAHPHQRSATALFRWRLSRFRRPSWAEMVVIVAAAACASQAHLNLIRPRGQFFVMACARTWCFETGHSLQELATHLPKQGQRRCWVPLEELDRRRTDWTSTKRVRLRHVGAVTSILSQRRRNDGPKQTNILVTNLPEVTARQVVDVYRRRWAVERLSKAWQGTTGVGQPQVTKAPQRVERSVALSLLADLMPLKFRARDIPAPGPWSALALTRHLTWQLAQAQLERSIEQRLRTCLQERKAA